jgi:alpha/beta superfamily hydrolase
MTEAPAIQSFFLNGPAGRLEAILNRGSDDARYAALVCHPHPMFGGTMHNKVVFHAMKALNHFGFPVLRFNFRAAGLSEGVHAEGDGEKDDVRAMLDWLAGEYRLPIIFAGFSFGAAVGMRVACPDERVKAIIALGTPVQADNRTYSYQFLAECLKPKLFCSGDHDQFAPVEVLKKLVDASLSPKQLVLIGDADHFFAGHLAEMRHRLEEWLHSTLQI